MPKASACSNKAFLNSSEALSVVLYSWCNSLRVAAFFLIVSNAPFEASILGWNASLRRFSGSEWALTAATTTPIVAILAVKVIKGAKADSAKILSFLL